MINIFYRHWCTKCQDWELFSEIQSEWRCNVCSTPHQAVRLNTIPKEKLEEQRKRYKQQIGEKLHNYLNYLNPEYSQTQEFLRMMSEPGSDIEIVESDAGQKAIEKKRREEYEEKRREEIAEILKYKHLGRNETCTCGSGKKYKKCCLSRIEHLKSTQI